MLALISFEFNENSTIDELTKLSTIFDNRFKLDVDMSYADHLYDELSENDQHQQKKRFQTSVMFKQI